VLLRKLLIRLRLALLSLAAPEFPIPCVMSVGTTRRVKIVLLSIHILNDIYFYYYIFYITQDKVFSDHFPHDPHKTQAKLVQEASTSVSY